MMAALVFLALQLQIPSPTGFVNDFAGVVDAESKQVMLALIDEVRAKSGGEIVVVTLPDLAGRPAAEVARDIGREWKVGALGQAGDPARNAGVVLLLKPGARPGDGQADLFIATGTGAEGFMTDLRAGRIRDAIGQAAVQEGSYAAGLVLGVGLLAGAFAEEFGFELTGAVPRQQPQGRRVPGDGGGLLIVFFVLMLAIALLGIAAAGGVGLGRRRGSGLVRAIILGSMLSGRRRGGGWGGGFGGGGFGGGGFGGGGFGGFGGGGGFSGGGAGGRF